VRDPYDVEYERRGLEIERLKIEVDAWEKGVKHANAISQRMEERAIAAERAVEISGLAHDAWKERAVRAEAEVATLRQAVEDHRVGIMAANRIAQAFEERAIKAETAAEHFRSALQDVLECPAGDDPRSYAFDALQVKP
jgi:predicted  nucleic acid-binding Zn-ribbon protein